MAILREAKGKGRVVQPKVRTQGSSARNQTAALERLHDHPVGLGSLDDGELGEVELLLLRSGHLEGSVEVGAYEAGGVEAAEEGGSWPEAGGQLRACEEGAQEQRRRGMCREREGRVARGERRARE